jgi:Flp pilus assembly protein TadG
MSPGGWPHRAWLARFRLGKRGIAAVEFGLCAPFLLLLIIGTLEMVVLYRTQAKLNCFAGNFAQMVASQENAGLNSSGIVLTHSPVLTVTSGVSPPGLSDLCAGAVYGLQPFPASGLTVYVASVTKVTATTYDEWETDLNSSCTPTGAQNIGVTGTTGARTIAVGNGGTTALVRAVGDNVIIVRASLQYPGLIGLFIASAPTLTQTAIARWIYASATQIANTSTVTPPAATLEFQCSGTGCKTNFGV